METARVELARHLDMIKDASSSSFIVAMAHVEYKKPIRDEHQVKISCWVSRIGERSWDLDYTVIGPRRVVYATGRTTQVSYDYDSRSTIRISEKLKKQFTKYAGKPLRFRQEHSHNEPRR
jgi:acyl-CoA thioesterase FadM